MKIKKYLLFAGLAVAVATMPAAAQIDTGNANFANYVSMGDSLTAGYSSGSLHVDGQNVSYPSLIHLQAAGGAGFEQPLVSDPGAPNVLVLQSLSPLTIAPKAGQGAPLNLNLPRPYNNLAVPGATIGDVVSTVSKGAANPLFDLVLRGLATQLQQAAVSQPTFYTVWAGNNDALGAATSGLVIDGVTLTPTAVFEAALRTIVGAMGQVGAQGAIANIPSVTAIPFVTTIPPFIINPQTGQPVVIGGQPVTFIGPNGPLAPNDYVLLTASGPIAQGFGIPAALGGNGQPLDDTHVLSAAEAAAVEARVAEFNGVISAVASEAGLALVDVAALYQQVKNQGVVLGGIHFSTDFITGGLFSYDGVHPSPLGYGIAANAFIQAINASFGGAIPQVPLSAFITGDLGDLPGTGGGAAAAGGAGSFIFTKAAYNNLRKTLGTPKAKKLKRIKKKMLRKSPDKVFGAASGKVSKSAREARREARRARREARIAAAG